MGGPPSRLRRFGGQTSLVARLAGLPDEARRRRAKSGAEEGIRTPTLLRAPAPQAGASASSATSAFRGPILLRLRRYLRWRICQFHQFLSGWLSCLSLAFATLATDLSTQTSSQYMAGAGRRQQTTSAGFYDCQLKLERRKGAARTFARTYLPGKSSAAEYAH